MATRKDVELAVSERQRRVFSESFKREKVRELERGLTSVSALSKAYHVTRTAIYRWIGKYGSNPEKKERLIVESSSDTQQLLTLRARVAELERLVGQKQIIIDYQDTMIELAKQEYGIDIKKNCTS